MDTNVLEGDAGILTSLRYYDSIRASATDVVRVPDSNVDVLVDPATNEEIAMCHLSAILPFTTGDFKAFRVAFEDTYAIALAAHHMNTGDGSIVPELEGLNERCKIRFTTEFADTEFVGGAALKNVAEQTSREPGALAEQLPCAFIGAYRSAVSIPMSIVTGLLGYPQMSGASTSADLDDKSQYPLFGRTLPSDAGNAIPLIIYMREVLQIKHLVVMNVNDAYGNAYVEGMRNARDIHAPDMIIHQIPVDDGEKAVQSAVASAKATQYRFIFAVVFTADTHDSLMTEAYNQGMAGDGQHNWIFGDSFLGTLDNRVFEKNSPLHLAYRGAGLLEITGGVDGFTEYDNFVQKMQELRNPTDSTYAASLFPTHDHPDYSTDLTNEPSFLDPITNGFSPFVYEAAVALGLSACQAISDDLVLTPGAHVAAVRELSFSSISGKVAFDAETGSRDPSSALYKVANYREEEINGMIAFRPVITNLFQDSAWNVQDDYIFNDGTTNLPSDLPPVSHGGNNMELPIIIGIAAVVAAILGVVIFLFYENKRKKNDSVWQVKREDVKFGDPPEVLGQGTFGMVLLAEYRGTQVAVKRVIPPQADKKKGARDSTFWSRSTPSGDGGMFDHKDPSEKDDSHTAPGSMSMAAITSGMLSGLALSFGGAATKKNKRAPTLKQLKEEFMSEMRHLSKLRHPCVTTVMGALMEKGEEPMLIMEYMDHGSLYDLLHNETMIIEGELLLPILRDVSQGMRFLHSADPQVIHGDLKAANILVDSRFRAKVADFGLSQKKHLGGTGTPYWMAPELLRRETSNTSMSDVYSFGVILYEVYSRKEPYEGERPRDILRSVADKNIRKRPSVPVTMPMPIQSLMTDCLEDETDKRPSFEEIDIRLKRIDAASATLAQHTQAGGRTSSQVSLFDIFPRHVAEALQQGRKVEPEHKDCVTIFFSDIVGFTNISSHLDPRKVANMLDRLYQKFDLLSHKHKIFKVETIGDSWMGVTNLLEDQAADHCRRVAAFAMEAVQVANQTVIDEDDPDKGFVNIRVGFHSGSCVADVVGNRNPRYCLFGDSVNTASRMESNSAMNRINCSENAAELLSVQWPDLPLRDRGEISIKGKGKMRCYWVNEENTGHTNEALERLEAKRRLRLLETRIKNWGSTLHKTDEENAPPPEQAPPRQKESPPPPEAPRPVVADRHPPKALSLSAVAEMSGEFSGEGDSAEFTLMETSLKTRLAGGVNSTSGDGTTASTATSRSSTSTHRVIAENSTSKNYSSPPSSADYFV